MIYADHSIDISLLDLNSTVAHSHLRSIVSVAIPLTVSFQQHLRFLTLFWFSFSLPFVPFCVYSFSAPSYTPTLFTYSPSLVLLYFTSDRMTSELLSLLTGDDKMSNVYWNQMRHSDCCMYMLLVMITITTTTESIIDLLNVVAVIAFVVGL